MPMPLITRQQFIHDLRCVAKRLNVRRISRALYAREGSFSPFNRRFARRGQWSALCLEAGLLRTGLGTKGIDERPCTRCRIRTAFIHEGREQTLCCECRKRHR
jgi:hypothetical protein